MKNKTLITVLTIIFAVLFFFTTSCFAANEVEGAVQGVRDFVGGAENVVEDVATGVSNTVRGGMDNYKDMTKSDYSATRTATTTSTGNNTFLGLGATAWGWFIMAVVGIITVALVWYYGKEHEYNSNHNDDNY